jgi:hypothetical protein
MAVAPQWLTLTRMRESVLAAYAAEVSRPAATHEETP